ncbi:MULTISPECIES: ribbon-helix-helix domain-containing protein [Brasilonema]|nr:type II toxin-antitoxin system ParD family antitoxin [Brasilonema sennae]
MSLTPELEQFVQTQVESGRYASAQEVVLAAWHR